jgi:endoglucanase
MKGPGAIYRDLIASPLRGRGKVLGALAVALAVLLACSGCGSRLAVQVVDNQLVGGQGQPIRLLGVNRSGPEYACIQGLGIFAGPTDKRAIAAMTAWEINAVRIPLNESCWLGINGAPPAYSGDRYRAAVSAYVARLHRAGLYVVLDLHWSAPGTRLATGQQPMADLDHSPAFWASVARTFRADPAIIFDLYNEPFNISWRCWRDGCTTPEGWRAAGMQSLVDAVRSTGAEQPVIASGLDWGNDLSSWLEYRPHDPANQVAAGFHAYDFRPCVDPACWTQATGRVARAVPVVTTELGQTTCDSSFLARFTEWAGTAGVSYLGWSWNPTGCSSPALIRSWDGQPTASGDRFRAALRESASVVTSGGIAMLAIAGLMLALARPRRFSGRGARSKRSARRLDTPVDP